MKTNSESLMNAANYRVGYPVTRKARAANYLQIITPCLASPLFCAELQKITLYMDKCFTKKCQFIPPVEQNLKHTLKDA